MLEPWPTRCDLLNSRFCIYSQENMLKKGMGEYVDLISQQPTYNEAQRSVSSCLYYVLN